MDQASKGSDTNRLVRTRGMAAYYSKQRKVIDNLCNQTELSAAEVIDLSDTEDHEMSNAALLQAPKTTQETPPAVSLSDMELLKSDTGWLNDKLINHGQLLLKSKFADVEGLNDVRCSDTLTYPQIKSQRFV